MATRLLFSDLIRKVKEEVLGATAVSASADFEETIKSRINKHYELLFDEYYTGLRIRQLLHLKQDQRFYSYPELGAIEIDNIKEAYKVDAGVIYPIEKGIFKEHYSLPDLDLLTYRYDWVDDDNTDVMEIYPAPSKDEDVYFEVQRKFRPLVNEDDKCYIDGWLVILSAANDILEGRGENSQRTKQQLDFRFTQVRDKQDAKGDATVNLHRRVGMDLDAMNYASGAAWGRQ